MEVQNQPAQAEEISLRDRIIGLQGWVSYLKRKWLVFLIALIVGVVVGFVLYKVYPKRFVANTTFVLDEANQQGSVGPFQGLGGLGLGQEDNGYLFSGNNLMWLYTSSRMLGETLLQPVEKDGKKILLLNWLIQIDDKLAEVDKNMRGWYPEYKGFPNTEMSRTKLSRPQNALLGAAIGRIKKDYLTVQNADPNTTGVISVVVSAKEELFAFSLDKTLVDLVNKFYIDTKTKREKEQVDILQTKVNEFNKNVSSAMNQAATAQEQIPFANPLLERLNVPATRKGLDVDVNGRLYGSLVVQLEQAKTTLSQETPLIQIIDQPYLPLGTDKLIWYKVIPLMGCLFLFLVVVFVITKESYFKIIYNKDYPGQDKKLPLATV